MDIDSDMYTIALYWNEYEWKCIYSLKPLAFPKYTYIVQNYGLWENELY